MVVQANDELEAEEPVKADSLSPVSNATFAEGVYVLHAFEKQTRRTRPTDIARSTEKVATS